MLSPTRDRFTVLTPAHIKRSLRSRHADRLLEHAELCLLLGHHPKSWAAHNRSLDFKSTSVYPGTAAVLPFAVKVKKYWIVVRYRCWT